MKIKEVIEKTKLTDRAIRLYIDNGLVFPGIEENYSGRKNIDFSENDVERLNQIALLRKAGFSISDIKTIISDDEKIEEIVTKFIEETDEELKSKTEVLEKLKTISFDEKVSLKILCEKLSPTVGEAQVPQEDLKDRKIEQKHFKSIGFAGMIFPWIIIVIILLILKKDFIHLVFTLDEFILANAGLLLTFLLGLVLFILNRKKVSNPKKCRRSASIALTLIGTPIALLSVLPSVFLSILFFCESRTTDVKDYMVVDSFVENFEYSEELDLLFPDEIPKSAKTGSDGFLTHSAPFTTQYYYRYFHTLDPELDIVAQWKLNDKEYLEAIKNAESIGNFKTVAKGSWTCFYFKETEEKRIWTDETYCFLIFAYNEDTNTVRYIVSYSVDALDYGPYYLTLDW